MTTAEQETYLMDKIGPDYIQPPGETAFANATWMHAGPEIMKIVDAVMAFDEFNDVRHVPMRVVWRRKTSPMRGDEPVFASVELVKPRVVWEASQIEVTDFPRYFLDLHWAHFNDLRNGREPGSKPDPEENPETRGAQYVHHEVLQQHIHHALSHLYIDNDILSKRQPDFSGFAMTVKRFGLWNRPLLVVRRQMSLWPDPAE